MNILSIYTMSVICGSAIFILLVIFAPQIETWLEHCKDIRYVKRRNKYFKSLLNQKHDPVIATIERGRLISMCSECNKLTDENYTVMFYSAGKGRRVCMDCIGKIEPNEPSGTTPEAPSNKFIGEEFMCDGCYLVLDRRLLHFVSREGHTYCYCPPCVADDYKKNGPSNIIPDTINELIDEWRDEE